jgi:hypothetical protein
LDGHVRACALDSGGKVGLDRHPQIPPEADRLPNIHTGTLCPPAVGTDQLQPLLFEHQTGDSGAHLPGSKDQHSDEVAHGMEFIANGALRQSESEGSPIAMLVVRPGP